MSLPRVQVGDVISVDLFNALIDAANRARLRVAQSCGILLNDHPDGYTLSTSIPSFLWAKTTGAISGGQYPWVLLLPDTSGAWTVTSITGTAYEANGNTSVASGTYIQLYKLSSGIWEFRASLC